MLSTLERLAKAKALRDAVLSADASTSIKQRVILSKQADGLRAVLLGRRANSIEDLDLFNPADSLGVIRDHFGTLSDAPDAERIKSASYLYIVAEYMASLESQQTGSGRGELATGVLRMLEPAATQRRSEAFMSGMFDQFVKGGSEVYDVPESVAAADAELKEIAEEAARLSAWQAEQWRGIEVALSAERRLSEKSWEGAIDGVAITNEQARAYRLDYIHKHEAMVKDVGAVVEPKIDANRARRDQALLRSSHHAAQIKRAVLAASPVSQEAADDWAQAQTITPGAVAALKRKGYDPKHTRADMAEFYRLTGGRLPAVTIRASRGRASAEDIHGHKTSIINMGSSFNKRVLFHEMGHHLEADPTVYAAAKGYLMKRRESDQTYSLRKLTGNSAYKSNEVAFKDSWFDAYVGKHYKYDVTEVMSMGVESYCDDATLARRMRVDPQMFAMITGFMKTAPDPLFGSVKKVFGQIAEADKLIADETEEEKDGDLSRLASGVEFVKLDPPPEFPWFLHSPADAYIGTWKGIDCYACRSVRDPWTKRKKKGHMLIKVEVEPASGSFQTRTSYRHQSYTQGFDQAKAAARVFAESGQLEYLTAPEAIKKLAEAYGS